MQPFFRAVVAGHQRRCRTVGKQQAGCDVVQGIFLLKMQGAQLGADNKYTGMPVGPANRVGQFQGMNRGIAAHIIDRSMLNGQRKPKLFDQTDIQTGRRHAGAAYRDQAGDPVEIASPGQAFPDGLNTQAGSMPVVPLHPRFQVGEGSRIRPIGIKGISALRNRVIGNSRVSAFYTAIRIKTAYFCYIRLGGPVHVQHKLEDIRLPVTVGWQRGADCYNFTQIPESLVDYLSTEEFKTYAKAAGASGKTGKVFAHRQFQEARFMARLRHVKSTQPGFTRKPVRNSSAQKGKSARFAYFDEKGKRIRDQETRSRIASLVIPPAWTEVWICPYANGHLQATGIDSRGRKQYIYHPDWKKAREENKYDNLLEFGKQLPRIRRQINRDLRKRTLDKDKVTAIALTVMEETLIRVGNVHYQREYGSHGLTTLRNKHVKINGNQVSFRFKGKKGVLHEIDHR